MNRKFPLSSFLVFVLFALARVHAQAPHSEHVVVITLENHSYEQVIGNPDMPYYNQLAAQYGLANEYYATQHNSLAALMWLTAGQQVTTNNDTTDIFAVDHLAHEVWQTGRTWRAYLQNLPSIGFTDYATTGPYLKRHAPFAYFSDVVNSNQRLNLVPLDPFLSDDLANNALPSFSYIVPDADEDAHDGTLAEADLWLQNHVPQILANPAFQQDGLLFIVWDEGDLDPVDNRETGGRIATLVIGPNAKRGYTSSTFYTHQDLLRTICDALALPACPGNGATGAPMADFFPPASTTPHILLLSPTANLISQRNPARVMADIISDQPASAMIAYMDNSPISQVSGGHIDFKVDLSPGSHHLVINGWDNAGRLMQVSQFVTVPDHGVTGNACVVDSTNQSVTICSARNSASVANPVRIVAETHDHDAEVLTTAVLVDGQERYLAYGNRIDTDLTLATGAHHITVRAQDVLGNTFESSADLKATAAPAAVAPAVPSVTVGVPLDGSTSSSPVHLVARLNSTLPASAMIVYADNQEVYRIFSGAIDAYLDLPAGSHHLVINAWDANGVLSQNSGAVRVPERIESCNEYQPDVSVTICSAAGNGSVAGSPLHFVAKGKSTGGPIASMIVYADNKQVFSTDSPYADTLLKLAPGTHNMVVNAWDSNGTLLQAFQAVTIQ